MIHVTSVQLWIITSMHLILRYIGLAPMFKPWIGKRPSFSFAKIERVILSLSGISLWLDGFWECCYKPQFIFGNQRELYLHSRIQVHFRISNMKFYLIERHAWNFVIQTIISSSQKKIRECPSFL